MAICKKLKKLTRNKAERKIVISTKQFYRILMDDFFNMSSARLEARRADCINAAKLDSLSASIMDISSFNATQCPHLDFLREAVAICKDEELLLDIWIESRGHKRRPKTPFLDTIDKASAYLEVEYELMCHEIQVQAREAYMPSKGACRLILEARFFELAQKMELDERDLDVDFGEDDFAKLDELTAMKMIREVWRVEFLSIRLPRWISW
ncbi:MAG: hypothetical protein Q9167_000939 [Letrouitia subvulpina]